MTSMGLPTGISEKTRTREFLVDSTIDRYAAAEMAGDIARKE
jgi:hypothetical protein